MTRMTSTLDQTSGTLSFTDVDLSDTHTVSQGTPSFNWVGHSLTTAQINALTAASTLLLSETDSFGTGTGSVGFTYSAADKTFDFLAQGDTLNVTYDVTVKDSQNITSTKQVTIAIIGTNDAPVLSVDHHYNIQDQFSSQAYNLNTGSVNWATNWTESNEPASNPATSGDIQVIGGISILRATTTRFGGPPISTGATAATLTFDYFRSNLDSTDNLQVQVSSDGGAHFSTLMTIQDPVSGRFTDSAFQTVSFDVSSFVSANTVVRFVENDLSSSAGEVEIVKIDNVNIAYTGDGPVYFENGTGTAIVGTGNVITDVDNTTMQSATITLTNHQASDFLSTNGALPSGINASAYDASTGVLTLTGSASLASYDAALHQVIFGNSSDNPSGIDRTVTMTVSDGIDNSNSVTTTVHVVPIDDAPTAVPTTSSPISGTATRSRFPIRR